MLKIKENLLARQQGTLRATAEQSQWALSAELSKVGLGALRPRRRLSYSGSIWSKLETLLVLQATLG